MKLMAARHPTLISFSTRKKDTLFYARNFRQAHIDLYHIPHRLCSLFHLAIYLVADCSTDMDGIICLQTCILHICVWKLKTNEKRLYSVHHSCTHRHTQTHKYTHLCTKPNELNWESKDVGHL